MESIWNKWTPCGMDGIQVESINIPHGIDGMMVEYILYSTTAPGGFHLDIPYGMMEYEWNMAIPYGIHVEYKWNGITKLSGITAKTYSIWNVRNPCGMTWNPHGFHMDSTWNKGGG